MSGIADWAEGVGLLHQESGGVMRVHLVTPAIGLQLVVAAGLGDRYAGALMQVIKDGAYKVATANHDNAVLCLCCPRPILALKKTTFCIVTPLGDAPGHALCSMICSECAVAVDLDEQVQIALRGIWPDLRLIDVGAGSTALH